MKSYQRTIKATPAGGWNIAITFEDGSKGVFDFSPYVNYPCYAPVREKGVFESVVADHGTLMWPGEIDIAPEAVWAGCQNIKCVPLEQERRGCHFRTNQHPQG